ncbi:LuxR family transcriptional regulator [Nocardioides litoris]|uniref:LuxR family transcriptional regulator n=1 Tax=Nocardioides litoris TaxID=1926648 RepID=UPI0011238EC3|nr:LuxR family transcriptional regulator [Nocardioides litoris]
MTHGPDERALFADAGATLYDEAVAEEGIAEHDPRIADGGPEKRAFDLLVELGLLQLDRELGRWLPEDPATVQSRVVSPLSQQAAQLLEESTQWARTFGALSQSWRRSPMSQARGPFTYLRHGAIGPFLAGLVSECEEEMLTAQPQAGRDAASLAAAALRDTAMLERGAKMRTLYQHSARRSAFTAKYVAAVSERGAEVRTLDEFFNRLIVVDRRVAVIPANDDLTTAVVVREPSVLAYLVDIFDRTWERARPFTNKETTTLKGIAAEQRAMTIRMLIEGHSDPVSAKRLGVSPRTYAGYVADLKAEYEQETRFQLGYAMGQAGVSGHEPVDDDDA